MVAAHNKISGAIPRVLQEQDFTSLDLSYNKISGVYKHGKHIDEEDHEGEHEHASKTITLHVNRLSGPLTETSYSVTRLLDGNLFGCDFIPQEDEHADTYSCGALTLLR